MKKFSLHILLLNATLAFAQFEPSVNYIGTSAMFKDSIAFVNWAYTCNTQRGLQEISNISLGTSTAGFESNVIGHADGFSSISLGDGGSAICKFPYSIKDEPGFDFAVFENSFVDYFLELAFVEVSSDGIHYSRFPNQSLTDTTEQIGTFDSLDTRKIKNLAGKYVANYGTPFDLSELTDTSFIDLNNIRFVKIIDVVGCIQNAYVSRDSYGRKINETWPTPFATSGFDLEAIGVIHQNIESSVSEVNSEDIVVYPNPSSNFIFIKKTNFSQSTFTIYNSLNQLILNGTYKDKIDITILNPNLYILKIGDKRIKFYKV